MKKHLIRLLAMLLCAMSFASLLPSAALAADADGEAVKEAVAVVANGIKQAADEKLISNKAREKYSYTLKVPRNSRVNLVDFNYYRHGASAYPFPVTFIWYIKKPGGSKWYRLKNAKGYMHSFPAKEANGYSFRVKTIKRGNAKKVMLIIDWKIETY